MDIFCLEGVRCLAAEATSRSPAHLAAAVRLGSKRSRVDVFEVFPGEASGHPVREPTQLLFEYHIPDEVKVGNWALNMISSIAVEWGTACYQR